jgi:hypothetical protein
MMCIGMSDEKEIEKRIGVVRGIEEKEFVNGTIVLRDLVAVMRGTESTSGKGLVNGVIIHPSRATVVTIVAEFRYTCFTGG